MTTRLFTAEEKIRAIELYHAQGAKAAAEQIGCTRQTVYQWLEDAETDDTNPVKKREGADRISNAWSDFRAQEALAAGAAANRMRREALEASTAASFDFSTLRPGDVIRLDKLASVISSNANLLKARVVAYGIFIDKAELLSGQATQRIQLWAESEVDRDLRAAMAEMEERIRGET